jgi:glycosyltransferase involved in cell wall biosynthesis
MRPEFSVITPSFRQFDWLRLCAASVADQEGVTVEHIVQDAGTGPELEAWAAGRTGLALHVEKDNGMYDAVNRGFRRAQGEILAYLNCDEQYLPGALQDVAEFFRSRPDVDIVFGDVVVIGPDGNYRFHRKIWPPNLFHTWVSHLSTLTCATFIRREFLKRNDLYFNPQLRDVGDAEWIARALKKRPNMAALGKFISAFGDTGVNMSAKPNAIRELHNLAASAPAWVRLLKPIWILHHRLKRAIAGGYFQKPFSYTVYTLDSPCTRKSFHAKKPSFRWRLQSTGDASA